jgi:integrase
MMGETRYQIALIKGVEIERPGGGAQPLGAWLVADVTTEVVEAFKARRSAAGIVTANRDLSLLRACFHWACSKQRKLAAENPFLDGAKAAVKLTKEYARTRRLQPGEAEALLAACEPHLRAVVEAALETGTRRGEILSLQWSQVEGMTIEPSQIQPWQITWAPKATIFLPAQKTKTKTARRIPLSARLKSILEMRRLDPAGQPLPLDRFVFGNAVGERVGNIDRAWHAAVLRSHGLTPAYTKTANLTPESRAALRGIGLHFHDLRREAGSRWLDGGMPLHAVRDLLGHSNVSQTSTYLSTTSASLHDAMHRFETRLQRIATEAGTGGQTGAQTAAGRDEKANENAVGRDTAIM